MAEAVAPQAYWPMAAASPVQRRLTGWVYAALASLAGRRRLGKGVTREGRRTPVRPAVAGLSRRRKPPTLDDMSPTSDEILALTSECVFDESSHKS